MTVSLHSAEDVAAEIYSRLLTCTIAQGAETDIGVKVYKGRRHVDEKMLPCMALVEGPDDPERVRLKDQYEIKQRYEIYAYLACDPDDPNVAAHAAIRDMKRALFKEGDGRFGGKVNDVEYLGRAIGPRSDGASFVVAAVELLVGYVETMSKP